MNTLKPCNYCGNVSFHYIPNMIVDYWHAGTFLGMQARERSTGERWTLTLVVCTQCGNTLTFTANAPHVAQTVPGSSMVQATMT